jgi:hypothetical protein
VEGFLFKKYDPDVLSEEEKKRFIAALGDGFGYRHRPRSDERFEEVALPAIVEAGLLKHRVYYDRSRFSFTPVARDRERGVDRRYAAAQADELAHRRHSNRG